LTWLIKIEVETKEEADAIDRAIPVPVIDVEFEELEEN
jgi:hypothetical protein|tara:strand:- start:2283 stop:2396 length:114 start_codon:yes stop_codon:yes gene_type:complete